MNLFERLRKGVVEDYFVSHDSTFDHMPHLPVVLGFSACTLHVYALKRIYVLFEVCAHYVYSWRKR